MSYQLLDVELVEVNCWVCGCGGFYDYHENGLTGGIKYRHDWAYGIFRGCMKNEDFLHEEICDDCASKMLPYVYKLRDIYELNTFINRLKKAINENIRGKDNGTTANTSGKRYQGRIERRP